MRITGRYYWLTLSFGFSQILGNVLFVTLTRDSPEWLTWIAIVPFGWGMSGLMTSTLIALIGSVERRDIAVATGSECEKGWEGFSL